jgi:D-alanyl-D-alanine carboxypeptidase
MKPQRLRRRFTLVAVLSLAMLSPALASSATTPVATPVAGGIEDQLQPLIDDLLAESGNIPGITLYVDYPPAVTEWSGATGMAAPAVGTPLSPDATFRIASVTKTFTAAAVLKLFEEGRLGLDQTLTELLPAEFLDLLVADGYEPDDIAVEHLLRHTSGLYGYWGDGTYQAAVFGAPQKQWTRLEQVQFAMDHGQPLGPAGQQFHYSDTNYILLGEIIERVSGLSQAEAYRSILDFEGLGLASTYFESLEDAPAGAEERSHQFYADVDMYDFNPTFDLFGGGGLVSTVGDLARFLDALMAGEIFDDPATLDAMLSFDDVTSEIGAGLGIFSVDIAGNECWGNGGAWGTIAQTCPEIGLTVVYNVNQAEWDIFGQNDLFLGLIDLLGLAE